MNSTEPAKPRGLSLEYFRHSSRDLRKCATELLSYVCLCIHTYTQQQNEIPLSARRKCRNYRNRVIEEALARPDNDTTIARCGASRPLRPVCDHTAHRACHVSVTCRVAVQTDRLKGINIYILKSLKPWGSCWLRTELPVDRWVLRTQQLRSFNAHGHMHSHVRQYIVLCNPASQLWHDVV